MKKIAIIAADGPGVRVELWRGPRLEWVFVRPSLDADTIALINRYIRVEMRAT